jgi:hypothetical protein
MSSYQNNHPNLLDDDDDDDIIPAASGLRVAAPTAAAANPAASKRPSSASTEQQQQQPQSANITTKKQKTTKTPKHTNKGYALIWVCCHGKGARRSAWRQKDLKIVGVYPSKAKAQEAKESLMSQYTCCGHGDILVGGTWEDEIDLVIRETQLYLDM